MVYLLFYLPLCLLIAYSGSDRKIGFGISFLVCLFLTPLVGFIVTILSPNKAQAEYYENLIRNENEKLISDEYSKMTTKSTELQRLQELRNSGQITFDEYINQKNNLLG